MAQRHRRRIFWPYTVCNRLCNIKGRSGRQSFRCPAACGIYTNMLLFSCPESWHSDVTNNIWPFGVPQTTSLASSPKLLFVQPYICTTKWPFRRPLTHFCNLHFHFRQYTHFAHLHLRFRRQLHIWTMSTFVFDDGYGSYTLGLHCRFRRQFHFVTTSATLFNTRHARSRFSVDTSNSHYSPRAISERGFTVHTLNSQYSLRF